MANVARLAYRWRWGKHHSTTQTKSSSTIAWTIRWWVVSALTRVSVTASSAKPWSTRERRTSDGELGAGVGGGSPSATTAAGRGGVSSIASDLRYRASAVPSTGSHAVVNKAPFAVIVRVEDKTARTNGHLSGRTCQWSLDDAKWSLCVRSAHFSQNVKVIIEQITIPAVA